MLKRITEVIHDDTRYLKGALGMRTQKCFAVKVMKLCIELVIVDAVKYVKRIAAACVVFVRAKLNKYGFTMSVVNLLCWPHP